MKFPIQCRVCERLALKPSDTDGWRLMVIDPRGDLRSSTSLALLSQSRQVGAYVCGQSHALVLCERYFERNTFEPVALADAGYLAGLLREDDLRAPHAAFTKEGK